MLKANYRLSHLLADLRFLYHFPGKMGPLVMWDFWTVFAYFFHSLALPFWTILGHIGLFIPFWAFWAIFGYFGLT